MSDEPRPDGINIPEPRLTEFINLHDTQVINIKQDLSFTFLLGIVRALLPGCKYCYQILIGKLHSDGIKQKGMIPFLSICYV